LNEVLDSGGEEGYTNEGRKALPVGKNQKLTGRGFGYLLKGGPVVRAGFPYRGCIRPIERPLLKVPAPS